MKIAVASCCKLQSLPEQPAWADIEAAQPDVLLLLGDNVYLEHDHHTEPDALRSELGQLYESQFAQPAFASLLKDMRGRGGKLVAIYDDHDFLGNNRYGGDHPPALREAARQAFVAAFAPQKTGTDVYARHALGLVDLVVLDARYYRRAPGSSSHDRDAVLGATQWRWLEETIKASRAPYLVIASSTTVHRFADESWEQYPAAYQRLADLLRKRGGALVVSGDIHRNETYDDDGVVEIVTSAVARRGLLFGAERRNWGLLTFTADRLHVQLHALKVNWRKSFDMPLRPWGLP